MRRYEQEGKIFQSQESNDCAIHAISATLGISYKDAYSIGELAGRVTGQGTYSHDLISAAKKLGFWFIPIQTYRIRLSEFVALNPVGRFYLVIRGHAISLINGEVVDTTTKRRQPGAVVLYAWALSDSYNGGIQKILADSIPEF
jgi:hypothetical protein